MSAQPGHAPPASDSQHAPGTSGPAGDAPAQAVPPPAVPAELADLRRSIDNIDAALVHLLAERFRCTQRVGYLKAATGLPPADPDREAQPIARLRALAESAELDPAFAEKFLAFVVEEVIRHHRAIAAGDAHADDSHADDSHADDSHADDSHTDDSHTDADAADADG